MFATSVGFLSSAKAGTAQRVKKQAFNHYVTSFSELPVQHSWGSMWTLQRRLLWGRGSEGVQSLPVPVERGDEQVGETTKPKLLFYD